MFSLSSFKAAGLQTSFDGQSRAMISWRVDMTALNDHLPELRVSYCPFEDAATLVQPNDEMPQLDLYKAFN
ncbi:hypothetical protein VYU27_010104 [Nannochloropsis oceanica]